MKRFALSCLLVIACAAPTGGEDQNDAGAPAPNAPPAKDASPKKDASVNVDATTPLGDAATLDAQSADEPDASAPKAVVGIIIAFQGLSAASASSIQSVAPGIAEALIATAAGIAAAVPASIFYNYFLNKVKNITALIDRFSLEMLNIVERNYIH